MFFQEGNDMFGTRIRNFYPRRVGDVLVGGKFIGKAEKYNINIISNRILELMDPIDNSTDAPAFFTAARVKRDILKSSIVGLTFADKSWDGDMPVH